MAARRDAISWIRRVQTDIPRFLITLKGNRPGFFHYSLSGDLIHGEDWGLNNTIFAVKIYHLLDQLRHLGAAKREVLHGFISSFRQPDNTYTDPAIRRRARLSDLVQALRLHHWTYATHRPAIMAQTRQAIAAEHLLGHTPAIPDAIPADEAACRAFVEALPWHQPWAAGSHLSHLLFFLHHSRLPRRHALIDAIQRWALDHQRADGTWYTGTPTRQQRLNGAMKVLTGLAVSKHPPLKIVKPLIDLCLTSAHDSQACDHIDITYVLSYASRQVPAWRRADIHRFAVSRLAECQRHYYPTLGGFSFYPGRANDHFYGARISRGLAEPDIHGTLIFLWTISLLVPLLSLTDDVHFNNLTGQ